MRPEQRKYRRKSLDRPAWISTGAAPAQPCTVRDVSETGARLAWQAGAPLPDRFVLQFSATGGVARQCRVAWRSDTEVGVAFLARLQAGPA